MGVPTNLLLWSAIGLAVFLAYRFLFAGRSAPG